jgi:flagellar basal body-associated protein FliL
MNKNDYNQSGSPDHDFDYYSPQQSPLKKIIIIILLVVVVLSVVGYLIFSKGHYFWDREVTPVATSVPKITTPKDTGDKAQPEPATFNTNVTADVSSENKYHIIAGAFIVEKNADNFMDELTKKGYQPKVVLERNNYRFVGIFSFPTFKEANEKYKSLQSEGIPIWIMKY